MRRVQGGHGCRSRLLPFFSPPSPLAIVFPFPSTPKEIQRDRRRSKPGDAAAGSPSPPSSFLHPRPFLLPLSSPRSSHRGDFEKLREGRMKSSRMTTGLIPLLSPSFLSSPGWAFFLFSSSSAVRALRDKAVQAIGSLLPVIVRQPAPSLLPLSLFPLFSRRVFFFLSLFLL